MASDAMLELILFVREREWRLELDYEASTRGRDKFVVTASTERRDGGAIGAVAARLRGQGPLPVRASAVLVAEGPQAPPNPDDTVTLPTHVQQPHPWTRRGEALTVRDTIG